MLLSTSDFTVRPYRIINIEESRDFIDFAKAKEKDILKSILGYSLWKDIDQMDGGSSVDASLTALVDGGEYLYLGVQYEYHGLVDLLKPAVMSLWIEKNNFRFTSSGYVESAPQENTTLLDPQPFIVELWNEYVSKVGECYNQKGTLYGFMKANEEDYPDWEFTLPTLKNRFGL